MFNDNEVRRVLEQRVLDAEDIIDLWYDRLVTDNPFMRIYMALRDLCSRHRDVTFEFVDLTATEERAELLYGVATAIGLQRRGDHVTAEDFYRAINNLDQDRRLARELEKEDLMQMRLEEEKEK